MQDFLFDIKKGAARNLRAAPEVLANQYFGCIALDIVESPAVKNLSYIVQRLTDLKTHVVSKS